MPLTLVNKTKRVNESLCDHVFGYSAMGEHTHSIATEKLLQQQHQHGSNNNTHRNTEKQQLQQHNKNKQMNEQTKSEKGERVK